MSPIKEAIEALEQLVVAVQNATPDEGCEQSIAHARGMGEAAIQSLRSIPDAKPVVWAIFTDVGNARMWTTFQPHVQKLADAEGLTVTPLYTAPPQASQPCDPAPDGVCEALECGNHGAEPVAWRHDHGEENGGWGYYENASCEDCQPLYTTPPQDAVDAKRYRWLRDRFLGPDYAWGNPATGVWAFETYAPVSADLGASIDAAIAAQKGQP